MSICIKKYAKVLFFTAMKYLSFMELETVQENQ